MNHTEALKQILTQQSQTIQRHQLENGETVWVRKAGKTIPQWRYKALGLLATTFNLGALQPVPNQGGQVALNIEAKRLQELAQAHINAPKLLAQVSNGIMFSHLGEHTLLHHIENKQPQLDYWQHGLAAIAEVHQKNQYLSQAFARNIIVQNNHEIGFIDFEDDPALFMSLAQCQSRDYLCYIQSTATWLNQQNNLKAAAQIWQTHRQQIAPEVHALIEKSARMAQWMRHLKAQFWGSDTLRLAALAQMFYLAQ